MYANNLIKRAREIKIFLALCLIFISLFFLNYIIAGACKQGKQYFLEIIERDNSDKLFSVMVKPDELFYLEYKNSRDLNPVIDLFKIGADGCIYLIEERYPWFGVGQECHPSKEIIYEDGMVVVKVKRKFEKLTLRVAYTVKQILKIKNQNYSLNSITESGKAIELFVSIKGG